LPQTDRAIPMVEMKPIMVTNAPTLLLETSRKAVKVPSSSTPSSHVTCMSRAWSSAISASLRSQVHFTGRPTFFDAQAQSGTSGYSPPFMP
jgi:hypothetical protein